MYTVHDRWFVRLFQIVLVRTVLLEPWASSGEDSLPLAKVTAVPTFATRAVVSATAHVLLAGVE